jgi:transposase
VAEALGTSSHKVWAILRKEGTRLQRQRTWRVSADSSFAVKAADVAGLYVNPPQNALVLSIDEKPSVQAIKRPRGYVMTRNRRLVVGVKTAYERHGAVNLFAALEVAAGVIKAQTTELKKRVEFLEFMDLVLKDHAKTQEIHVLLDNCRIHKNCDDWLTRRPNVKFHFTPTSASWLNMVEIWFGVFSRKALKGASFTSTKELTAAIKDFVDVYNDKAEPFIWRKREVKGSQLRNTVYNLTN